MIRRHTDDLKLNHIYQGDALEVLQTFPAESVHCVVTSPPYWALRDYDTADWNGGDDDCDHVANPNATKKMGNPAFNKNRPSREKTKTAGYYADVCPKCGAIRNDKQLGIEPTWEEHIQKLCDVFDEVKRVLRDDGTVWVNYGDTYGLRGKSLYLMPFRFAVEMVDRGWILRNTIIWHKPNCMPESVKDRFTVDFEYMFFFVKRTRYAFAQQFEQTSVGGPATDGGRQMYHESLDGTGDTRDVFVTARVHERNLRSVWTIATTPFPEAHFAVYPEELIVTPLRAGCPKGGIVLDPFMGSGTTAVVARKLGRNYVGIELNPEYIEIAKDRLRQRAFFDHL